MRFQGAVSFLLLLGVASAQGAGAGDSLITFDPRRAEVRQHDGHWWIVAEPVRVKDCGHDERTAREVLNLIRDWNLTQRGTVGRPWPVLEYWLTNGQAPQPTRRPLGLLALDSTSLRVEQVRGQWCLRDNAQVVLVFGPHAEDAQRALEIVNRHGFGALGSVGSGLNRMVYLLPASGQRSSSPARPADAQPAGGPTPGVDAAQLTLVRALFPDTGTGEVIRVDARQAEVVRTSGRWQLAQAGYCLADFGPSERDARDALRLFRQYRFTDRCHLGPAGAGLTFYLSNGQPPCELPFGVPVQHFRADSLVVRQVGGAWAICDGGRVLWRFEADAEAARQALEIIRRHQFAACCRVGGQGPQPLMFLVKSR